MADPDVIAINRPIGDEVPPASGDLLPTVIPSPELTGDQSGDAVLINDPSLSEEGVGDQVIDSRMVTDANPPLDEDNT